MKNNYLIPVIEFSDKVMAYGKGSYVYDVDGNRYLDLNSGQFCTVLGHSNQVINEAVNRQMNRLIHTSSGMISDVVVEFSRQMHKISGDMKAYSISLCTGAEAVEFCLRYAKCMTNKSGVVCFEKGYHGLTLGAQSVTYSGVYANPSVENIYAVPCPNHNDTDQEVDNKINYLNRIVNENKDNIACILLEPIVSVGGMIIPQSRYFKEVRKICNQNNIVMIFDESQTGFGRTGEWFAYQSIGVIPDMVALAKGIGNGYPVSISLFSEKCMKNKFEMTHYSSHQNDPFSAAVVNACINYINENNLLAKIKEKGITFLEKLKWLEKESEYFVDARGKGMMMGIDLNIKGITNYRPICKKLSKDMVRRGVFIQCTNGGKTVRFLPDYLMQKEDFDYAIETLNQSMNYLLKKPI